MKAPKKVSEELAEEIGWHIGDGSMNFYNNRGTLRGLYQLRGHIEDDQQHYEKRIKPIFEKLFKIRIRIRKMPSTRVIGFQIWNNDLVKFKEKFGLPLGKKRKITIPQKLLKTESLKKAVLKGIFDTDGGIYLEKKNGKLYPIIYITTISKELSNQLLKCFKELKFRATKYSQLYNKKFNRQRAYFIRIRGKEMFQRFMKEINPKNPKHQEKYKYFLTHKTYK